MCASPTILQIAFVVASTFCHPPCGHFCNFHDRFLFTVVGGQRADGSAAFAIHRTSGVVTTRAVLDHEQQDRYSLVVVARDKGVPPMEARLNLKVHVLDLNDNQPTFFTSSLSFQVREGVPVGSQVGLVNAVDQDAGENGHITYAIVGGNIYNVFDIGGCSCCCFVARKR